MDITYDLVDLRRLIYCMLSSLQYIVAVHCNTVDNIYFSVMFFYKFIFVLRKL